MTYPALLSVAVSLVVISLCGFLYEWREKKKEARRLRDYLARPVLASNHPQRNRKAQERAAQALKRRGAR